MVVTGAASVSAIIDPYGRQVALDFDRDGSELIQVADVTLGTGEGTIYTSLGDILGWVSLAGMILFTVHQAIDDGRAKKSARK